MRESTRAPGYACIYHGLATIARRHGYALSLHGSMLTDLDLVAIPWTDEAIAADALVEELKKYVGLLIDDTEDEDIRSRLPTRKPHGRIAWRLSSWAGGSVDLSVMPRVTEKE